MDGPNEPPYILLFSRPASVTATFLVSSGTYTRDLHETQGHESGINSYDGGGSMMEVEARWKWKHDGSGSTMEVVSGSGKWKYCEVVVDGPNEPP